MAEDYASGMGKGVVLAAFLEQCQRALAPSTAGDHAPLPDRSYFPPSFVHGAAGPSASSLDLLLHLQVVSRDKLQKQELFVPATSTLLRFTRMLQCLQRTYFRSLEPGQAPPVDCLFGMETCVVAVPGAPCLGPFDREFRFRYEVLPWRSDTRWLDLPFPVHCNTPYVYIHQECCAHYFIIKSIRTAAGAAASGENGSAADEALRVSNRKKCRVCETHSATLVVSNCSLFSEPKGAALLCCQLCFEVLLPGCALDASRWDGRAVHSLVSELTEEQKAAWGAEMEVYPLYYHPSLRQQQ